MNAVERVKKICKERKIALARLEKDCGFANGYIGSLKKGTFPDDRLKCIADYLGVSVFYLMTGETNPPSAEYSEIDSALTGMTERMKIYALKLAQLSSEKQEHVMSLIDMFEK
ncbi:MAG: helix-turn-helix transcriptional regulator [Lachnospiraceae bacterium]|nr:helix-turn-helix transcriptional regulator [Lachnospiraceae bacterium]